MKALITGGAGYIGSVVASALERRGHAPVILDSLVAGRSEFVYDRAFYRGDIADDELLERIANEHSDIGAVIHCAALILVPESVACPNRYYLENVSKSIALLSSLSRLGIRRFIFSSSASVYGDIEEGVDFMVTEASACNPMSPYARSKLMVEEILRDFDRADLLRGLSLRYFNPIGADPEMRSGPYDRKPSHIMGKILSARRREADYFSITGTNYPTRDGTGIRDYVHVWDIAEAHAAAIEQFDSVIEREPVDRRVINLGSGSGTTVRELLDICSSACDSPIPYREAPPRPGDVAGIYANRDTARRLLGWESVYSVEDGVRHAIEWERRRSSLLGY